MYCNQCEQTARGVACTIQGVCGKKPEVAALQDLLIHSLKGLSIIAVKARNRGIVDNEVDQFMVKAAFATLTNVNFDPARFVDLVNQAVELRSALHSKIKINIQLENQEEHIVNFKPASTLESMIQQGENVGLQADVSEDPDIQSLHQIIIFGLKGVAAYAHHALLLGQKDEEVFQFIHRAFAATVNPTLTVEELTALALECGKINLRAMELLDTANTSTYGHPTPTKVPLGVRQGKAILVSGHDLQDLEEILKQTEGKHIFVYTHGEMLPTHAYPKLKKYSHFYGHYGTAWQNQQREFAEFPGAIVMTTNCLQKPRDTYKDKIFTVGVVGWPDITHITKSDFTPAIEKALELPGFPEDIHGKTVTVGFGHKTVLSIAEQIITAVKEKEIRHFFLVAGCDGAKPGRNYYTEFVEQVPKDSVVLTLACGKFRFFDKELGEIKGIPRLIDVGQCNDAYSAIQIAVALANAFNVGVNDLPLSLILSWYEQKAVAILLSLLHLGIRDIRLGPSLPAFITSNVLNVLIDKFNIMPITTPKQDLQSILGTNI